MNTVYNAYNNNGVLYVDATDVNWNNAFDGITLSTEASLSTTSETVWVRDTLGQPTDIYEIICELQNKISILEKEIEELKLARIKQEELEGLI